MIIVNGFQPLTIITKRSIMDVAAVLYPPLIMSVYKKKNPTDKTNYKPVSILHLLSKVFEKVMYIQLYDYMDFFLNQPL